MQLIGRLAKVQFTAAFAGAEAHAWSFLAPRLTVREA